MRNIVKTKKIVILFLILMFLSIPTVYAFYFSKYESSVMTKFNFKHNLTNSYVRAAIITYWIDANECQDDTDLTTCDISGKASWNLKNDVINSDWILLDDGYYYYKLGVDSQSITETNIKETTIALIDEQLSFAELSDELLTGDEVLPQYEIIYEFIECDAVEDAWNVSYEGNIPEIIQ